MKKFLAILIALCMCLSVFAFVGCDDEKTVENPLDINNTVDNGNTQPGTKTEKNAYNGNYRLATETDLAALDNKFSALIQEFIGNGEENTSKISGFSIKISENNSFIYGENSLSEKYSFSGQLSDVQDANGSSTVMYGKTDFSYKINGDIIRDLLGLSEESLSVNASGDAYLYEINTVTENKVGMLLDGNIHISDMFDFQGRYKYEPDISGMSTLLIPALTMPTDFDENIIISEELPNISELLSFEDFAMIQQYIDIYVDLSENVKVKISLKQDVVNEIVAQYLETLGASDMDLNVEINKADVYIVLNTDGTLYGTKIDFDVAVSANVPDFTNPAAMTTVPLEMKLAYQSEFNKSIEEVKLPEDTSRYVDITEQINENLLGVLMGFSGEMGVPDCYYMEPTNIYDN